MASSALEKDAALLFKIMKEIVIPHYELTDQELLLSDDNNGNDDDNVAAAASSRVSGASWGDGMGLLYMRK